MKTVYYIITIILSALLTGLFLLISFPLNKDSVSALLVALMLAGFLTSSVVGLIKKSFIPGVMLAKAGILLIGFGAFCFAAAGAGQWRNLSVALIIAILLLWALGALLVWNGINICKNRRLKTEENVTAQADEEQPLPEFDAGRPADPNAAVKKIWQYEPGGKPKLTGKQSALKWSLILLCGAGIFAGMALPMILMFQADIVLYGDNAGMLLYLLSIVSILGLGFTLGEFKAHHTENRVFVLGEDGSVFMINYFDPQLARDFGYYEHLPRIMRNGHATRIAAFLYPFEAERCYRYLRESKLDQRIAAQRVKYGYQISAVPEICQCGYFSEIRFMLWVNGCEQEYKNLFQLYDNCYEDYDGMIEYFTTRFAHRYDEAYHKKTNRLRVMTGIGVAVLCIGLVSFLAAMLIESNALYLPGFLGLIIGIALLAAGLDALRRRHIRR